MAGSFLSSEGVLTGQPMIRHAELNSWFRFTKAGEYHVQARSQRIWPASTYRFSANQQAAIIVDSNIVDITILPPDPTWSTNELSEAKEVLNSDFPDNEKFAAARRLCSLDTPGAASELARQYLRSAGATYRFELYQGVLESSFHSTIIPILEADLYSNTGAVRSDSLSLLAELVIDEEDKIHPSPKVIAGDAESNKALEAEEQRRSERILTLVSKYRADLSASVEERSGSDKANSIFTLWEGEDAQLGSNSALPSQRIVQLRSEVVSVAKDLNPQDQYVLLEFYWDRISSLDTASMLRTIATARFDRRSPTDPRDLAWRHWCELDRAECERALVAEILQPKLDLSKAALLAMPKAPHPELDAVLGERLSKFGGDSARAVETTTALIERYATPALSARVQDFLASNKILGSYLEDDLIAYLLRVDKREGLRLTSAALAIRTPETGCYKTLLGGLAARNYVPELSQIALSGLLHDPSSEAAADFATLLAAHGPTSSEEALWQRFEQWSEKWRGHSDQLRFTLSQRSRDLAGERQLENNLAGALAQSKLWTLEKSDFSRLSSLCVTDECRTQVTNWENALK